MKNKKIKNETNRLSLIRDRRGMSTVEYAILLAVICAIAFGTWDKFGKKVRDSVKSSHQELKI